MKKLLAVSLLSLTLAVSAERAPDPAAALAEAKAQIATRQYAAAVNLLEPAIKASEAMTDASLQKEALTALHFYAAVAYSGMGQETDAASHLRNALRFSPNLRAIDASKYDPRFVALFRRVRGSVSRATDRFEELYPGYSESGPSTVERSSHWENPALEILGSRKEKRDWEAAVSPADREKFMNAFWGARASRATEKNLRNSFTRRVAFADAVFELPAERGAMTDRGRVFAVLGPPAAVRRRPLTARDSGSLTALNVGSVGLDFGSVESWIYTRAQLPVSLPASTVTFRFVTHQGIGEYVLQKDGIAMNVLASAAAKGRD